jgi:hypothetical protein
MFIKEILMKKVLLLLAVLALLFSCVTTTENSVEEKTKDVANYPLFEAEYFNLVQFDENDVYDKDATDAAADLLLRNHPFFKEISYVTPVGEVTVKNPYYDAKAEDSLLVMNNKGEVDWEATGPITSAWANRYRSITRVYIEFPNGHSNMTFNPDVFDNFEDITPLTLGSSFDDDEGRWRAYDYKNPIDAIPFDVLEIDKVTYVNDPSISKYAFWYYIPKSVQNKNFVRVVNWGHGSPFAQYGELIRNVGNESRRQAFFAKKI